MKVVLAAGLLLLLPGVAACGEATEEPRASQRGEPVAKPTVPAADGPVTTRWPVTVLDDGDGAELCLGGQLDSYPPQCGGPRLVGWDWSEHAGDFEAANGVRWGGFAVTGMFDGSSFSPSEVVPADEFEAPPSEESDFSTTCPEPARGGWTVDDSRVERADMDRAFGRARQLDRYAFSFVDTSADPRSIEQMDQDAAAGDEDVSRWIVNARVTGDVEAAEAALREVWGGGLCVLEARYTDAELEKTQMSLNDVPGMLSTGRGLDRVDLEVAYDDGSIQAWADETYGDGLVRVTSALVPVG